MSVGGTPIDYPQLISIAVSSVDFDEVCTRLSELVQRTLRHEWMRICLHPQHDDELQARLTITGGRVVQTSGSTLPLHDSLPGTAIATGRPVVRSDLLEESVHPDERALALEHGLRSVLVLPLVSNGRTVGTMDLGSSRPMHFAETAVQWAEEMAPHIGAVVEHAWLLEESKELSKISERRRLAWEIHDTVVQTLIGFVLQLELAQRCLRTDVPRAILEVGRAHEMARQCLEETRHLVLNLRPPLLERSSLSEAIARELEKLEAEVPGVQAKFSLEGSPVHLQSDAETALYRVAQETFTNIRKHARASVVSAALSYLPDAVRLTIRDNGVGFDPAALPGPDSEDAHFGITAAHQRMQSVCGQLRVVSLPGEGTTLTAQIPADGTANADLAPRRPDRPAEAASIRVLLVDDHTVVRQGLRHILEQAPDISVVDEASESGEALEKVRRHRPDVAIVDVQLPGTSGIDLVREIGDLGLETRSLILSAHRGGDLVLRAIRAGAHGYLLKDIAGSALIEAIYALHRGEMVLHPIVSNDLATNLGGIKEEAVTQTLTARELDVLRLIALGLRNKEIARKLYLTEATVKYHVAHLLGKLGADSRTEALVNAQKLGILTG